MTDINADFKRRLTAGEPLFGIFVKTFSHQIVEVLGHSRLDCVVIDAEHAPFDRNALDVMLLAAQAARLPAIVRIPEATEAAILAPLDMGAAGLMIPHVRGAAQAAAAVGHARYVDGARGFSNSPRAGRYGARSIADHLRDSDASLSIIAMIEDMTAIEHIEAIAAVDGIDALFIGRVDLAVTLGHGDVTHPEVEAAVQRIYSAAPRIAKPLGALATSAEAIPALHQHGVRLFLVGTDQGLLRGAVSAAVGAARTAARPRA